jgi:phosphotransferase system  glucose/maltose/N-acetylglucosamine-specific IIC component
MENKKNDYTKMDEKTIATIKASVIWNTVSSVIMSIAAMVTSYIFIRNLYNNAMGAPYGSYVGTYLGQVAAPQLINIGTLINSIIGGIIGGAISGWVIAKFYPVFVGWQKKYTGNKLDSFFKILFWPYLVIFVIFLIITGGLSLIYSGFLILIITAVADVAAIYLYAKMMDKAVGKYYK